MTRRTRLPVCANCKTRFWLPLGNRSRSLRGRRSRCLDVHCHVFEHQAGGMMRNNPSHIAGVPRIRDMMTGEMMWCLGRPPPSSRLRCGNSRDVGIESCEGSSRRSARSRLMPQSGNLEYMIEGHVPSIAIRRLLDEKPEASGLAVPGMPVGSPGIEVDGFEPEIYSVIIFGSADQRAYGRFRGATEI